MQRRILTTAAFSAAVLPLIRVAQAQTQAAGTSDTSASMLALSGGAFAMQTSQLATSRATAQPIRQFAQMEVEEQTAIMQALQLSGMTIPSEVPLDAMKAETMRRLRGASGADFDRAYLEAQITGHQELQRLHTAIAAGSGSAAERAISTVAVPGIKTHLVMLQMMQEHHRG